MTLQFTFRSVSDFSALSQRIRNSSRSFLHVRSSSWSLFTWILFSLLLRRQRSSSIFRLLTRSCDSAPFWEEPNLRKQHYDIKILSILNTLEKGFLNKHALEAIFHKVGYVPSNVYNFKMTENFKKTSRKKHPFQKKTWSEIKVNKLKIPAVFKLMICWFSNLMSYQSYKNNFVN